MHASVPKSTALPATVATRDLISELAISLVSLVLFYSHAFGANFKAWFQACSVNDVKKQAYTSPDK